MRVRPEPAAEEAEQRGVVQLAASELRQQPRAGVGPQQALVPREREQAARLEAGLPAPAWLLKALLPFRRARAQAAASPASVAATAALT